MFRNRENERLRYIIKHYQTAMFDIVAVKPNIKYNDDIHDAFQKYGSAFVERGKIAGKALKNAISYV